MTTNWSVPRIFEGKTVAVLASGHGLTQSVADSVKNAGIPALVTNNSFKMAPWADILVANDAVWWNESTGALDFAGFKVCVQAKFSEFPQVMGLKDTGALFEKCGVDPNPENVRTGGNSGYTAVHIAMQAGAKKILLCGMNMGGDNWHGPHAFPLRITKQENYAAWINRFESLVKPAKEIGVEIVIVTPNSALKCFAYSNLHIELKL